MTPELVLIIEELFKLNTKLTGPQFSLFITNEKGIILSISDFILNKPKNNSELLKYKYWTHYSVNNKVKNLKGFSMFTTKENIKINNVKINNIRLNSNFFNYANLLSIGPTITIDDFFLFYDKNQLLYDKNSLCPKYMEKNLDMLDIIEEEAIEIFNNIIIKNNSPNNIIFEEVLDKNKNKIIKIILNNHLLELNKIEIISFKI